MTIDSNKQRPASKAGRDKHTSLVVNYASPHMSYDQRQPPVVANRHKKSNSYNAKDDIKVSNDTLKIQNKPPTDRAATTHYKTTSNQDEVIANGGRSDRIKTGRHSARP
jgi:hypothetical protein